MALIAQLGEHCTGIAEVVGSNPAQSLKFFSGLCSSSVTAALALMTVNNIIIYSIYRALIPNGPKALYIIKNNDKILNLQNYIVIL